MDQEKNVKTLKCVVVSDKMDKTRVAKIERRVKNDHVGKYLRKTTKLVFHDEGNKTAIGDEVLVQQTKPMSRRKRFTLTDVLKKAEV